MSNDGKTVIFVVCSNASGEPEINYAKFPANVDEEAACDCIESLMSDKDYEGPFIIFGWDEAPAYLRRAYADRQMTGLSFSRAPLSGHARRNNDIDEAEL